MTALSIMRLLAPETSRIEGSVKLSGRELLTLPEPQMREVRGRQIGMVFQEAMTSLNPLATVGNQIAEVLTIHGQMTGSAARAEAVRLLERVRIPAARSRANDLPHSLSGGMRQRVMIAMALACRPQLLIADEPTTALDVTIQAQILALIKELQHEEGMGVLFITHDMGVVAEIADRTVVMLGGEVVEQDRTEAIFASAQSAYTKILIAAVPRLGTMQGVGQPQHFPTLDRDTGMLKAPTTRPDTVDRDGRPVLAVRNLVKRFDMASGLFSPAAGRVHAVEDVSFDLHAGETLALVGESGCGKSTTGRAIMRLVEPQAGSILLDGTDILALDKSRMRDMRRHIQMIFQDPFASLNPRIRVGDAIAEPYLTHRLGTRAQAREKVAALLEQVGLDPGISNRYPQQFSGGQRQRICIARALALEPTVIVADESVSGLDVSIKAQVVNLLLDLQQSFGLSYLFISHDMAVVERMSPQGRGDVSRRDRRDRPGERGVQRPAAPLHQAADRRRPGPRPGAAHRAPPGRQRRGQEPDPPDRLRAAEAQLPHGLGRPRRPGLGERLEGVAQAGCRRGRATSQPWPRAGVDPENRKDRRMPVSLPLAIDILEAAEAPRRLDGSTSRPRPSV